MASMSLDNEIKNYLPLLAMDQKESLLSQIRAFLKVKEAQPALTREEYLVQYNNELDAAEKEVKDGHFISQEDLESQSESW